MKYAIVEGTHIYNRYETLFDALRELRGLERRWGVHDDLKVIPLAQGKIVDDWVLNAADIKAITEDDDEEDFEFESSFYTEALKDMEEEEKNKK